MEETDEDAEGGEGREHRDVHRYPRNLVLPHQAQGPEGERERRDQGGHDGLDAAVAHEPREDAGRVALGRERENGKGERDGDPEHRHAGARDRREHRAGGIGIPAERQTAQTAVVGDGPVHPHEDLRGGRAEQAGERRPEPQAATHPIGEPRDPSRGGGVRAWHRRRG